MIEIKDISYSYGRRTVISGLSLTVRRGECAVLAGPNGSGKTTALSVIAGILNPSSGTVSVGGRIGYVPQGSALLEDATVSENLRFFADLAHARVPDKLPFSVGMYLDRRVSKLSGGMKKQVSIACALVGDPEVILLDEPCSSLDVGFRRDMIGLIDEWKREGKAIVYVGHDPAEFISFFDTVTFLDSPPVTYGREKLGSLLPVPDDFRNFYTDNISKIERK